MDGFKSHEPVEGRLVHVTGGAPRLLIVPGRDREALGHAVPCVAPTTIINRKEWPQFTLSKSDFQQRLALSPNSEYLVINLVFKRRSLADALAMRSHRRALER